MGLIDDIAAQADEYWVTRARASDLVHGACRLSNEGGGWVRPWRVLVEQERALSSCQAWHPGLFAQMARTTAGITVRFETDAQTVVIEARLDDEPAGTSAVLGEVDPGRKRLHDGLSADVGDRHLEVRLPRMSAPSEGGRPWSVGREQRPTVTFDLGSDGSPCLPGLGESRVVSIHLPALRGCAIRDVICDGTYLRPVKDHPDALLLGDSIAQGFVSDDPALCWASLVARDLGWDIVNQGIGGHVFQATSLAGLSRIDSFPRVIVAYGANYRYEPCTEALVRADARAYFDAIERLWPMAHVWVTTPLWADERVWPVNPRSCYAEVPRIISDEVARHAGWAVIDGLGLMDHDRRLLAADGVHPNRKGHAQMATRMVAGLGEE